MKTICRLNSRKLKPVSDPVIAFLRCPTPRQWLQWACENQDILLIDHANCEKKAAATAMNLLYRYVEHTELLTKMSQLAREELLHFEQVVTLMSQRGIAYVQLGASRYAGGLREHLRKDHHGQLIDILIVGAFVEARSCERFAQLAPLLDQELAKFYRSLLRSEARHFEDYLALARLYAREDITPRIAHFAAVECSLIESEDQEFRFHSGVPAAGKLVSA
jgi:tRNA 2-(methylsulfanyl)-N6-isopentenyladenosine37 hydroxylase